MCAVIVLITIVSTEEVEARRAEVTVSHVTSGHSCQNPEFEILPPAPEDIAHLDIDAARLRIARTALACVDRTRYRWGGSSLKNGADCSGFIWAVYKAAGYEKQFGGRGTCSEFVRRMENGRYEEVQPEDILPGDVVIYLNSETYMEEHPEESIYGHCAIYVGDDQVVHCKGEDSGCVITPLRFRINKCEIIILRILKDEQSDENITSRSIRKSRK